MPPRSRTAKSEPAAPRITDPRFARIQTDPLFRLPSKKATRVPLDARFRHLLRDDRFSSTAKVDRYGRRLQRTGKDGRNAELERLYRNESDNGEEAKEKEEAIEPSDGLAEEDGAVERAGPRTEEVYDPAREGGFSESSSAEASADDESDAGLDASVVADERFEYPERQADGIPDGEVTSRLAVVNLDWDHVRAEDLLAVFSSFVSGSGKILKTAVYPSEFGKERMDREATEGPPKEVFPAAPTRGDVDHESEGSSEESADDEEEDDDERIKKSLVKEDDGEEFNPTQLRRYQLERLRYYYAVLTCSSPTCAEGIYQAVDGLEYGATANFFDVRFVPDATDFSMEKPRDECEVMPARYRPNAFVTDALQHSRVKLTWDADDGKRKETQMRAFAANKAEIDENDLKAYLGSDSSGDEAEPASAGQSESQTVCTGPGAKKEDKKEQERQRMRALLGLGAEPEPRKKRGQDVEPVGDMQITFTSGLSEQVPEADGDIKTTLAEETTIEKYKRKEKERKMRRKQTGKSATAIETEDGSGTDGKDDAGFDDPFFEAPDEADRQARKAAREQKRAAGAAAAEEAAADAATLRRQLAAQGAPDDAEVGVGHFDMGAIERGEKTLRRLKAARGGRRGGRTSARDRAALETKRSDRFEMDVHDPRFGAIYERSEFALDPSHPRFKGTEGMMKVLQEGRRKRAAEIDKPDEVVREEDVSVGESKSQRRRMR